MTIKCSNSYLFHPLSSQHNCLTPTSTRRTRTIQYTSNNYLWLLITLLGQASHTISSIRPHELNPLNAELYPICYLLALLGAHHFLHVSRIRVKSLTLRLIMSYTGCNRRKGQNFGRVLLMLKYTDITQNTYIQSWTVTEIMAREVWNFDSCYTLTDYKIHIITGRNMWFL